MAMEQKPWPTEGYRPEWLALEDAAGGRYMMVGNLAVDGPTYDAVFTALSKQWPALSEELEIWDENTGSEHANLDVRIYRPKSVEPLPLMVFFPGGGYICGNLDTEDAHCRIFAAKTPCLVISVNYPKTPAVDLDKIIECGTLAVRWCRKRADDMGSDSSKTVVCGGSAGAFLTAQVAYNFITKQDPIITGCILLFPSGLHWDYDGKYKFLFTAWEENGAAQTPVFGKGKELGNYIWSHYNIDLNSPRHLPLLASDEEMTKFPPSYIVCAEKDVFRDDGKIYNHRFEECGVKHKMDYYAGLPHWFHAFPQLAVAHEMMAKAVDGVRFVLAT